MADLRQSVSVHFVGIGGVGMSGLAHILLDFGEAVSGSDSAVTPTTRQLRARGAAVACGHAADNLPKTTEVVVHSSAVPESNAELREARRRGLRTVRRGHFLAELAQRFPCVIAVAGSHGKTTTTAMLAHILRSCGKRPGFLVGGEVNGWPVSATAGGGHYLVTEVDESDGTQDAIDSALALVTNIEDDHCWSVGGEAALHKCFADFATRARTVLAWDAGLSRKLLAELPDVRFFCDADIPGGLEVPMAGEYNLRNASLALAAAVQIGVTEADARAALRSFPGVKRRMTCHYASPDNTVLLLEDYAHHPTELRCLFEALRSRRPDHRLVAIFQPHRFERVKRYRNEFAEILGTADEVVVTAPFAAWVDEGGEEVRPADIADAVRGPSAYYWDGDYPTLAERLMQTINTDASPEKNRRPVMFAVIGAGSISGLLPPLRNALVRRELNTLRRTLKTQLPEMPLDDKTPWRNLTTLGIGDACPLLAQPRSDDELRTTLIIAREHAVKPFILGHGSNLVGTDEPLAQLVVKMDAPALADVSVEGNTVTAGAGAALPQLCRMLLDQAKLPPELAPLAWIPGSLGGAVRMNAGAATAAMADWVASVDGIRFDGSDWTAKANRIEWGYRQTNIPDDVVIRRVRLSLPPVVDLDEARRRYRESGEQRRRTQPSAPSAGCAFRNAGDAPAGRLIDRCGCKGRREGGCQVSRKHANFLIRDGQALESHFIDLMLGVRFAVFQRTGILLTPEAHFVNPGSRRLVLQSIAPPVVAVLKGGPSAERAVSLNSGAAVAAALRQAGAVVHEIDIEEPCLPPLPPDVDAVVPMLHGTFGEDGQLQRLLDQEGYPYAGSGTEASALMMDKQRTKIVLRRHGLPTPQARAVADKNAPLPELRFPIIVKPCRQGSSVGMTRLDHPNESAWHGALAAALAVDETALAEEFVDGVDLTVGLLNGEPLPAVEIRPPGGALYDYDAKYEYARGHTEYFCPPSGIPEKTVAEAVDMARQAYRILGARHLLRVDFRIDPDGAAWILEANTIPGFTATSLLPKAARQAGISFTELCAALVATKESPPS
ncbi:MAG: D-alanine--D-alanine ligase [Verrucomicrobiota bacterium]